MIYADIIVDISHEKVDRSFQYKVPEELQHKLQVGMVVTIPFGNGNHERKGYVIGLSDTPAFDTSRMKELTGICSSEETTEERLIALGYSCGPCGADGINGAETQAAIKAFQRDHGLAVDGIVGQKTWSKLLGL